jgi:hypothetical protein
MGLFYGPLACSTLYVIVGSVYWERQGKTITAAEARVFGLVGLGGTLCVLLADFIQSNI